MDIDIHGHQYPAAGAVAQVNVNLPAPPERPVELRSDSARDLPLEQLTVNSEEGERKPALPAGGHFERARVGHSDAESSTQQAFSSGTADVQSARTLYISKSKVRFCMR